MDPNFSYRIYRNELLGIAVRDLGTALVNLNDSDVTDPADERMRRYQAALDSAIEALEQCRDCEFPEQYATVWRTKNFLALFRWPWNRLMLSGEVFSSGQ